MLKLIAHGRNTADGVEVWVHPPLLPSVHPLASVRPVSPLLRVLE